MKPINTILRPDMMVPPPRTKPATVTPLTGLGDAVARVANPIAAAVDKLTGSKLTGCGGCAQRREALNRMVPDITKPFSRSS